VASVRVGKEDCNVGWEPQDFIALVGVVIAPMAALGGAWLNSYLARKEKLAERAEAARKEWAAALGPMLGILADAEPSLVANAELREYETAQDAITGLYDRWLHARESLLVMHYSHPSERVRKLAFDLQAKTELSLRMTAQMVEAGEKTSDWAQDAYWQAGHVAGELGQELLGE
jgi:hypothetical protein